MTVMWVSHDSHVGDVSSIFAYIHPSMCHFAGRREAKYVHRYHLTPVASYSSTVAEEIVVLVRRLHSHPSWTLLINHHVSQSLQQVSHLVASPSELGVGEGTGEQKVSGQYRLPPLPPQQLVVLLAGVSL